MTRLKSTQPENSSMTTATTASRTSSTKAKPIPHDMHSITPHLVCAGAAAAIDFYIKAFGAQDCGRLAAPDGKLMHAMIRIGDSALMLVDENLEWGMKGPKALGGSPVTIHLYVENVDEVFTRAVKAGAKVTMPLENTFWGDRYGKLEDPWGHQWSLATHIQDLSSEEIIEASKNACCGG
jgi:uncharacterized glyoxalase superfamily protein PhnB